MGLKGGIWASRAVFGTPGLDLDAGAGFVPAWVGWRSEAPAGRLGTPWDAAPGVDLRLQG